MKSSAVDLRLISIDIYELQASSLGYIESANLFSRAGDTRSAEQ